MRAAPRVELDAPGFDPEAPGADTDRPRHPNDPRTTNPRHKERGPARFPRRRPGWTYESVAEAAGVTEGAVKQARARGLIDMESIASVAAWIAARIAARQARSRKLKNRR